MTRIVIALFMAFLISSPLAPAASSQIEESAARQRVLAPHEQAAKSKFIFFQLPAPESAREPLNIEFRFRVDNLPYLVERFTISPDEARLGPSLELLAREPGHLQNLYRLAKKEKRQVSITVMANDQVLREFSFGEMRKYNRELRKASGFKPLAFESKVLVLRNFREEGEDSPGLASTSCEQQCSNEYAVCAEMECGSSTVFCGPCLDALNQCQAACPPPPPPPNCPRTTCSSTTQLIGSFWNGMICLNNVFWEPKLFDTYLLQYKKTTTCTTVDPCAGTQSTSTSYQYFDRWCDVETPFTCDFPMGFPFTCF
jgi:hypothetical protein